MNLKHWLTRENEDSFNASETIRVAVGKIWERPLHRYYTDHSVYHSERIIEKLNNIVDGLMGSSHPLSETETLILLAAAYLHDIGMQDEHFRNGNLEEIREQHHKLTRRIINDSLEHGGKKLSLGLEGISIDVVDVIALVAESHRKEDLSQDKYDDFIYENDTIRPRLLAALLRLADELDIDHRRVHMQNLYFINAPNSSIYYWYLCFYVSGLEIKDGSITVCYRFPEGFEHYSEIIPRLIESKIQEEFDNLQDILWENGVKVVLTTNKKVRYIPGLDCMPSEIEALASEELDKLFSMRIHRLTVKRANIPVPNYAN